MHEDMTVAEFCDKHGACAEGVAWCRDQNLWDGPMSALWDRDDLPNEWRVWVATRNGVLSDRDARMFACWCARQVWHLLTDERSRAAVEVAERYANGDATEAELSAADAAAWSAARSAAEEAAWSAAEAAAAWSAAWSARAAADEAAWSAARSAAEATEEAAAAWSATEAAQVARLREAGNPFRNDGRV